MSREIRPTVDSAARATPVDLVLLVEPGEHFAVYLDNGGVTCPQVLLEQVDGHDLRSLVQKRARQQLDLDLSYLGLLAFNDFGPSPALVVAASIRKVPGGSRFQSLTLADIKVQGRDVQHRQHFVAAHQLYEAVLSADGLSNTIRQSMIAAVSLLTDKRAQDNGQQGWDQYLDTDSVGVVSTADGILAIAHARGDRRLLDEPIATLRKFQDPQGGWPIRRSLMGTESSNPITESTCKCLWALYEAGLWSMSDPTVRDGIAWLERTQRPDGGWSSAAADDRSLVFPTASAVQVLALFNRSEAVSRGVVWLRDTQCADGGWGAKASAGDAASLSSAAYTAAAVLALSRSGIPPEDRAVRTGCEYLFETFSPERPEPWASTSFTSVVDTDRHARMDFRHFATPWALAALCEAGYDLSDPVILNATQRLLRLQQPSGAWRCDQTAPDVTVIWAVHGAVYALRSVIDSSGRTLAPLIRDRCSTVERHTLENLVGSMLGLREPADDSSHRGRNWLSTVWMSLLTVAVALLILDQTGVFKRLQSSSGASRVGSGLAAFVVTALSAVAPTVIAEKFWIRRRRD